MVIHEEEREPVRTVSHNLLNILRFCLFLLAISSIFMLIGSRVAIANEGEGNIEELRQSAEDMFSQENYEGAAMLYDEVGLWYLNKGDWDGAAENYQLSAESYAEAGQYENAANSYAQAGDCYYDDDDFDSALTLYQEAQVAAETYQQSDPDYDSSWIADKIDDCQSEADEQNLMVRFVVIGVLMAVLKFASKAALGSAYSPVKWKVIFLIASVYLALGIIAGLVFKLIGITLVSDKITDTLFDYGIVFGLFQVSLSLILAVFGFLTIRKWKQGRDISSKTFMAMVIPCPTTIVTIFTSVGFVVVAGLTEINAGLLIGGVFFISILGMVYLLRKFKPRTNPTTLGVVMIFFALVYAATVLFVPAYLEASETSIQTNVAIRDVIPVLASILILVALGFVLRKIKTAETMPKIKGD